MRRVHSYAWILTGNATIAMCVVMYLPGGGFKGYLMSRNINPGSNFEESSTYLAATGLFSAIRNSVPLLAERLGRRGEEREGALRGGGRRSRWCRPVGLMDRLSGSMGSTFDIGIVVVERGTRCVEFGVWGHSCEKEKSFRHPTSRIALTSLARLAIFLHLVDRLKRISSKTRTHSRASSSDLAANSYILSFPILSAKFASIVVPASVSLGLSCTPFTSCRPSMRPSSAGTSES